MPLSPLFKYQITIFGYAIFVGFIVSCYVLVVSTISVYEAASRYVNGIPKADEYKIFFVYFIPLFVACIIETSGQIYQLRVVGMGLAAKTKRGHGGFGWHFFGRVILMIVTFCIIHCLVFYLFKVFLKEDFFSDYTRDVLLVLLGRLVCSLLFLYVNTELVAKIQSVHALRGDAASMVTVELGKRFFLMRRLLLFSVLHS